MTNVSDWMLASVALAAKTQRSQMKAKSLRRKGVLWGLDLVYYLGQMRNNNVITMMTNSTWRTRLPESTSTLAMCRMT